MTKAEILKQEILKQYKSVRRFGIPYSTLVTALERGVEGMAYGTVIRMCERLNLNPVNFSSFEDAEAGGRAAETRVMQYYVQLNRKGRRKILEIMEDCLLLDKYRE